MSERRYYVLVQVFDSTRLDELLLEGSAECADRDGVRRWLKELGQAIEAGERPLRGEDGA